MVVHSSPVIDNIIDHLDWSKIENRLNFFFNSRLIVHVWRRLIQNGTGNQTYQKRKRKSVLSETET